jgi:hypothetical protein
MPDSAMCIPEMSEIASVTSLRRNGTTFSICFDASSPGAQSRMSPLPSVGERARVRASGKRCGVRTSPCPAAELPPVPFQLAGINNEPMQRQTELPTHHCVVRPSSWNGTSRHHEAGSSPGCISILRTPAGGCIFIVDT